MKFIKGMIIGGMATAGAVMLYKETMGKQNKMIIKNLVISGLVNKEAYKDD